MSSRALFVLQAALLIVITCVAYSPVDRAGFIWDDDDYVTHNPVIRNADGLRRIWFEPKSLPQYYPLVHTSFWVEYQLWELNPRGYHWVNVIIHALNAILVMLVLTRLKIPGALLAAAVFAVHPVHVESVAWVTERKNTLSAFFYLLSLLLWTHWQGHRRTGGYIAVLITFACALLSKTVTCSLPAVMLIITWFKEGMIPKRDVQATAPLFVIGLIGAYMTAHLESEHVGATGAAWDLSAFERILIAGRALWFYAGKIVFPIGIAFNYPRWDIDAASAAQWIFPLSAIALLGAAYALRNRVGRGLVAGLLVFGGSLVPALGFIDVYPMLYSFVADHFQYLASLGLIVPISGCLAHFASARRTTQIMPFILIPVLMIGTWRHSHVMGNIQRLWEHTIEQNPNSWLAHTNLGGHLIEQGNLKAARPHLEQGLRIHPSNHQALNNLGIIDVREDRLEQAEENFRKSLVAKPKNLQAMSNLAHVIIKREGNKKEARRLLEETIALEPRMIDARYHLGKLDAAEKRPKQAIKNLAIAAAQYPEDASLRFALGQSLNAIGQPRKAAEQLSVAVRIDGEDLSARQELATTLETLELYLEAARHFGILTTKDRQNVRARRGFVRSTKSYIASSQDTAENAEHAALALRKSLTEIGNDVEVLFDLVAQSLERSGKTEEAKAFR